MSKGVTHPYFFWLYDSHVMVQVDDGFCVERYTAVAMLSIMPPGIAAIVPRSKFPRS